MHLVPYEVSSRGQILRSTKSSSITTLKHFKIKIKSENPVFKHLSKIALLSIFSIFHANQTKEWVSPSLLKPWLTLELACSWKWFTMYQQRVTKTKVTKVLKDTSSAKLNSLKSGWVCALQTTEHNWLKEKILVVETSSFELSGENCWEDDAI